MSEPRKRGEWQTPVAFMKNREEMYKKLESLGNKVIHSQSKILFKQEACKFIDNGSNRYRKRDILFQ